MRIKDRVAVVTGSGQGIGEEIASRLAEHGAKVVVCDLNREKANGVVHKLASNGWEATAVCGDVTEKQQVTSLMQDVNDCYGKIDILVNNVGIIRDNYIVNISEEDWDSVLDTNLKSYFLMTQAVAPYMMKAQYGRIVNISSRAWLGNKGQANYSAAKGGIISLTRVTAMEMGKFNITANAVAPGVIDTPMFRGLRPDIQERMKQAQPISRIGSPKDVAYAVHFFASDDAWYINGQCLYVCGGKSVGSFFG